jgi:hypothetical protein
MCLRRNYSLRPVQNPKNIPALIINKNETTLMRIEIIGSRMLLVYNIGIGGYTAMLLRQLR